jgi:hypothetical protein
MRGALIEAPPELLAAAEGSASLKSVSALALLSMGLFNAAFNSRMQRSREMQDRLVGLFEKFAADHADIPHPREKLARTLFNAFKDALEHKDQKRAKDFQSRLEQLAGQHAGERMPTLAHAQSLVDGADDSLPRAEALAKLRALVESHQSDKELALQLAMGLRNGIHSMPRNPSSPEAERLLNELRGLAARWPGDAAIAQRLAQSLFMVHFQNRQAPVDTQQAEDAFREMGLLLEGNRAAEGVREAFAGAIYNRLVDGAETIAQPRRAQLQEMLYQLSQHHPEHAALKQLVQGAIADELSKRKEAQNPTPPDAHSSS